jgi:hypothetical protein
MNDLTRRRLLLSGVKLLSAAVLLPVTSGRVRAAAVCVEPASETARAGVHYVEPALNPAQACAECAFFTMDKAPCGNCMLVKGTVSSKGHCDSWSDKNA